jgi:DNA-binding IclR family transcriptional regulator
LPTPSRTPGVDSARKVLQLLLEFTEERPEATVEELAQAVSASVSSTYRYVALLRELGLVDERYRGTYVLSPRVLALARGAEAAMSIVGIARPVLDELAEASGETAFLLQQMGDSAVCVGQVESDHPIRLSVSPGHTVPLHRGAAAKVILANLGTRKIRSYLERLDDVAEQHRLEGELGEIRRRGWAVSLAELDAGVWASAAPVMAAGSVVAAVSVAAPDYRLDTTKREEIIGLTREASREISGLLTSPRA